MGREMIRGIVACVSGGLMVFSLIVLVQFLVGIVSRARLYFQLNKKQEVKLVMPQREQQNQKMESFAYAVNGLSEAFFAMSQPKQKLAAE